MINTFGDLARAEKYADTGFKTTTTGIESFFITGTESEPIEKTVDMDLPELEVTLAEGLNVSFTAPVANGSGKLDPHTLSFPAMTLGSTGNILDITIENTGSNQLDKLEMELWDKDAGSGQALDTASFTGINPGNIVNQQLSLNNEVIEEDDLELRISYEQSSGVTAVDISLSGLQTISVKKVESLEVADVEDPQLDTIAVELSEFEEIKGYDSTAPKLEFSFATPTSMNMDFDFHSGANSIELDGNPGTYDAEGDSYYWQGADENDTVSFGTLELNGSLDIPDDNIINYDAEDTVEARASMIGKAEITDTADLPEEMKVENGDLVFESEPMEVDMSQGDIDKIKDGVIKTDDTYLETVIDNGLSMELEAEVYFGNDKNNLYTSENKLSNKLLEVETGENDPFRFMLADSVDKLEETLTTGDVYMGIKFRAGNFSTTDGVNFSFDDEDFINTTSCVYVTLGVNQ